MNRKIVLFLTLLLLSVSGFSQNPKGSLVIVGGALSPDNKDVYHKMIELAGGPEKAIFAVIPSASGVAVQSWVSISKTLRSYGVREENIHLINISVMDDDSTKDVDESKWAGNANDKRLARTVKACSAVWFTGGDQMRTMLALTKPNGEPTPVLEAVWDVYKRGGAIGGSSAGAAIMSEIMIGNGNSMGALKLGIIKDNGPENEETDALLLSKGLGFFPEGIVDQHFNQRARIGRLIVALINSKDRFNLAFGIDENTALIYIGKQKILKVAGAAGVTIVNTSDATISQIQNLPKIENVMISYLEDGDTYDIISGKITPASVKKLTKGNEYYDISNPAQAGMFSGTASNFLNLITVSLIDNKAVDKVTNLNFTGKDSGFLVTMSKTPLSYGYYTDKPTDRYTVTTIRMDIEPVKFTIEPLK